ncbi:MAG: signal peptidase II [Akkermansia sp.]
MTKPTRILLFLIAGLYLLDQITKGLIVHYFEQPSFLISSAGMTRNFDKISIIDGYFNIVRVHNTGVAFGIGNGTVWSSYVFLAIPIIAIFALIWAYRKGFFSTTMMKIGWAFLLAGVCGNITDRLIQGFFLNVSHMLSFWECVMAGYVVDFIDIKIPWINYTWPSFNIADSCICISAVIFLICSFTSVSDQDQQQQESLKK